MNRETMSEEEWHWLVHEVFTRMHIIIDSVKQMLEDNKICRRADVRLDFRKKRLQTVVPTSIVICFRTEAQKQSIKELLDRNYFTLIEEKRGYLVYNVSLELGY